MKKILLGVAAVTAMTWLVFPQLASSKPDYAKKEGATCTKCHVQAGKPELNDTGKCYAQKKSLADCK